MQHNQHCQKWNQQISVANKTTATIVAFTGCWNRNNSTRQKRNRRFSGLICTELIVRELGIIVTTPAGRPLQAPLDVMSDVAWAGYANEATRAQIEPVLQAALQHEVCCYKVGRIFL
jgi:hypothetical protein